MGLLSDLFTSNSGVDFRAQWLEQGGRAGYLVFTADGIEFHSDFAREEITSIPGDMVIDVTVGADINENQRFMVTRMLLFKHLAFAMPKRTRQESAIVSVYLADGSGCTFALQEQRAQDVWNRISGYVNGYSGAYEEQGEPEAATLASQIEHLASFRDSGALTDVEFIQTKEALLRRHT